MADIVQFDLGIEAALEPPSHRRIRRASRLLSWLFLALGVLLTAYTAALVLAALAWPAPGVVFIGPSSALLSLNGAAPRGFVAFHKLSPLHQIAYAAVAIVRSVPAIFMFLNLRRLFSAYARGVVFARENAVLIRTAGFWLAADAVAPLGCHLFLAAFGWEIDRNWLHFTSLQELILGGVVLVIALVMEAGREIEEERGQYV